MKQLATAALVAVGMLAGSVWAPHLGENGAAYAAFDACAISERASAAMEKDLSRAA